MKKIPDAEHIALLPEKDQSVNDAFEILVEKYSLYHEKGSFRSPVFLEHFADRWSHILDNLPNDNLLQRAITMEFSHMANDILHIFGIDLQEHIKRIKNTVNKTLLYAANDRIIFQRFRSEGLHNEDLNDMEVVIRYLNFLFEESKQGIQEARDYIKFCVDISQLNNGFQILKNHVTHQLYSVQHDKITQLEEMNMYLGQEGIDDLTRSVSTENRVNYVEATHMIGLEQSYYAALHAYINQFYESNIRPYIFSISVQERYELSSLLNDFRDILDPSQRIPDSFVTKYPFEQIERNAILFRGRNLQ
ncbi:hypothetical protein K2X92_00830 [Candidatus Gracilibacteria bacterium]|nr:hypothetical protein [Candidatus Gracilibacteria bacterium]